MRLKRILLAAVVAAIPTAAEADNVRMNCPSSVAEGGLVAQGAFDRCRHSGDSLGRPYCEFRDGDGQSTWTEGAIVGPRRAESVSVTIDATTGGRWYIFPVDSKLYLYGNVTGGHQIGSGDTVDIDFKVYAAGNYRRSGNSQGMIGVYKPGNQIVSSPDFTCTITIRDDDNAYYVGRRAHHPYGGVWQNAPHCYTPGCAWD